jgi:hypothetical protein
VLRDALAGGESPVTTGNCVEHLLNVAKISGHLVPTAAASMLKSTREPPACDKNYGVRPRNLDARAYEDPASK